MSCEKVINHFLETFGIKNQKNIPENTLISFLKNPKNFSILNSLQNIYIGFLPRASSLFDEVDLEVITNLFLRGEVDKEDSTYIWFLKFYKEISKYISFQRRNNSIYIHPDIQPNKKILKLISDIDWKIGNKIDENTSYILIKDLKDVQYQHNIRYLTEEQLKDIISPPSIFKFQSNILPKEINKEDKKIGSKGIAAFDVDGTIVNPSNILLSNVKEKLKVLVDDGYNIVFISNQKRRKIGDPKLLLKFEKIRDQLEIPFLAFAAREEDQYRKPNIGISYLIPQNLGEIQFYVGDAAGRPGDHSSDDKNLALNLRVPFYTPEEFFNPYKTLERDQSPLIPVNRDDKVMVLMIGYPGSGKSTYAKNVLRDKNNFEVISRDDFKTLDKCEGEARKYLEKGKNVVLDNTNFKRTERKIFIDLAKEYDYKIIGIHVATSLEQSMEWNKERGGKIVPKIAYYKLRKDFASPTKDEGIDEIYVVL